MYSSISDAIAVAAGFVALAMPVAAYAQQETTSVAETRTDPGPAAATPFDAAAIIDGDLQMIAGREDTSQIATASQTAGVSRNSVGDNSTTGDARVSDNAFQNLSGLSILNVNTGNNVAINAAMNVNITITPGR